MPVPVLSIAEMRDWEQASWTAGASETDVIAQVGKSLASHVHAQTRAGDEILILAGRGNNGADARAAADHLPDRQVRLLQVHDPQAAQPELTAALARHPTLVLDGLFGIGLNRPLDVHWIGFLQALNASEARVVAVDVPSGLNADSGETWGLAVRAEVTLTVGAPKAGLLTRPAQDWVGRLDVLRHVGLVGEPQTSGEMWWTLPEDFNTPARRRSVAAHKGSFGHALIIAGSVGYSGAAVLAARAASRARPGLVSVLTAPDNWLPVSGQLASAMVHPFLPRHPLCLKASAILAGPGLADAALPPELRAEVMRLWREFPGVMIVDASALDWLRPGTPCAGARLITPHPGEAARLLGVSSREIQEDRPGSLRRLAARHEAWVVLKGHQTLIGSVRGPLFINPSGNPGLAQGGTGDVLAGFLTGLLAQPEWSADILNTLRRGVWCHGRAADRLEAEGTGWTAEDLAKTLSLNE
mgnify:CR=1 FL=1